jgi:predicted GNAT family N-acyltransferase
MHAVELQDVGSAQWDAVVDGEQEPCGGEAEGFVWARKTRHVGVLDRDGRPLALAGVVPASVRAGGGEPFAVAGIGSVIVTRARRGEGLARLVIAAALRLAAQLGPAHAMLFCREPLVSLYARFGFSEIAGEVTAEQPGGRTVVPLRAMWAPLAEGAVWPEGAVEVLGEPF